ncbi:nuclear transport factor 2 family protein [Sandaracinus amylolyticus]|uniref:nuclear transport factor 2 family protein n=1 Tax=Sandaracinus amylolyticus TaxID=927083 RepID=UPI001F3736D9|nr:nuclear transport factor 2 family protein [Sandaracinus amylolyticus]UJR83706.1 Hypothetical protein I5071_57770 [Sandaracinus amylolyticus]
MRLLRQIVTVALSLIAPTASAQVDGQSLQRDRAAVERSFAAWAAGTGSPFELLHDDARWTIVGRSAIAGTYPSREAFLRDVIGPFNARMREPLRPVVREIFADRDTIIVLFDASGVARDGRPYRNTYTWYLRMWAGRIVDVVAFFDSIELDELWHRVSPDPASSSRPRRH